MAFGNFAGGVAQGLESAERATIDRQRVGLANEELRLRREKEVNDRRMTALNATRSEIDGLIKAAVDAKANGATPGQLAPVRKMIELAGADLGIKTPNIPQPAGTVAVPGAESAIQLGLRRFDALVNATPGPAPAEPEPAFAGTGMDQQSASIAIDIADRASRGEPLSIQDRRAYSLAYRNLTTPQVINRPDGSQQIITPTVDESLFPSPESLGAPPVAPATTPATVAPTAAGGEQPPAATSAPAPQAGFSVEELTPRRENANEAGRLALITQGADTIRSVRNAIVNPDGSVNRGLIGAMNVDIPGLGAGLPGSQGRTARAQIADALAAKLRLETGAQANEQELQNIADRFTPSLFDSEETVRDKLDRLTKFFESAVSVAEPELFRSLTERAGEQGNIPAPPADEPDADFQGFRADGLAVFKRPDGSFFGVPVNERR